jgi:hypothetical protein
VLRHERTEAAELQQTEGEAAAAAAARGAAAAPGDAQPAADEGKCDEPLAPPAAQRKCDVCFAVGIPAEAGVACSARHFTCDSCFLNHVLSSAEQAASSAAAYCARDGRVCCPAAGRDACGAPPFGEPAVARHVNDAVWAMHEAAQRNLVHMQAEDMARREAEAETAAASAAQAAEAEEQAQRQAAAEVVRAAEAAAAAAAERVRTAEKEAAKEAETEELRRQLAHAQQQVQEAEDARLASELHAQQQVQEAEDARLASELAREEQQRASERVAAAVKAEANAAAAERERAAAIAAAAAAAAAAVPRHTGRWTQGIMFQDIYGDRWSCCGSYKRSSTHCGCGVGGVAGGV